MFSKQILGHLIQDLDRYVEKNPQSELKNSLEKILEKFAATRQKQKLRPVAEKLHGFKDCVGGEVFNALASGSSFETFYEEYLAESRGEELLAVYKELENLLKAEVPEILEESELTFAHFCEALENGI